MELQMSNKQNEEVEETATELITAMIDSANMPRPAPELKHIQAMGADVEDRALYVFGEIDDNFGAWFTTALKYLERLNHDPITIWLNTPGGDVESMFVFHDLVQLSPCEITVIATGQVCSAGVLMLACCHKRYVTESCILMSHGFQDSTRGTSRQMKDYVKVVEWQEEHWAQLMSRYTPDFVDGRARDSKYWSQLVKRASEWWVTGGDAIVHEGLADAVLKRGDENK